MAWKEFDLEQWAEEKGVDLEELRQKEKLIKKIIKARKDLGLTQEELAHLVGVSQSRISQIESRVKVDKITFDVLLRVLQVMGFGFSISARKVREPNLETLVAYDERVEPHSRSMVPPRTEYRLFPSHSVRFDPYYVF